MISLGGTKINFQYENPGGFGELLTAVKPYVTEEDAERQTESATPGGTNSNQLAFQVCFVKCFYTWSKSCVSMQRLYFVSLSFFPHKFTLCKGNN